MREQKLNKPGTHIYTASNYKNAYNDYRDAQDELYKKQRVHMIEIATIINDYTGKNRQQLTHYQLLQELKHHYEQIERYEMLINNNRIAHNALEYFIGQDEANELIQAGMIFK
jgi:hypothetical protein